MKFVCFKWRAKPGYRSHFEPVTVNVLYSMLRRHYHKPFELLCITDDPIGIRDEVKTMELWPDFANMPSPHGGLNPSCYRRLKMFAKESESFLGPRFVSMDLDVVITDDITNLFDPAIDFKIYGDTARGTPYNGSLIYNRTGTRSQLWEKFDPLTSPLLGKRLKYIGSDQAWIGACLGPNEPKFGPRDGIYSYRNEIRNKGGNLPVGARMIIMHGDVDPWLPVMRYKHSWIDKHYRL